MEKARDFKSFFADASGCDGELLDGFDFPQMTVCEDVPSHFEWFERNFNANPDDCCNLGRG